MKCGAIDLGGTKIEARIFDDQMNTLETRRIPTPQDSFETFISDLASQIRWMEAQTNEPELPVAIAIAGVIDPQTGIATASNIPVSGRSTSEALTAELGRNLPLINDCMAFTYSEAHGGAADGVGSVLGIILGTGVGGGLVIDGNVPHRHAGLSVEIGHIGMSARALERHGLPLWQCGCGRAGCLEKYLSGTGMRRIAEWVGADNPDPQHIAAAADNDPKASKVMDIWSDLAGEMLYTAQLLFDPEVVVIGGGLSNIPDLPQRMSDALMRLRFGTSRPPSIRRAVHGDSAGARGAALMAKAESYEGK